MSYYVLRVKDKGGKFKTINSFEGSLIKARSLAANISLISGMSVYFVRKAVKKIMKGIYVDGSIVRSLGNDELVGTVELFRGNLVWITPLGEYCRLTENGKLGKKI